MKLVTKYILSVLVMGAAWVLMTILLFALAPVFRWFEKTSIDEDTLMSIYFGLTGCVGVFAGTIMTSPESRVVSTWVFVGLSSFVYFGFFVQPLINRGRGIVIDPEDIGFALGCFVTAFTFTIKGMRQKAIFSKV